MIVLTMIEEEAEVAEEEWEVVVIEEEAGKINLKSQYFSFLY